MIKRNTKQFVFGLILLLLTGVLSLRLISLNDHQQQLIQYSSAQSMTISSVNLQLINNDVGTRQGLATFLHDLSNQSGIASWQLIDSNNQLLSEKSPVALAVDSYHNLYFKGSDGQLFTLRLGLVPELGSNEIIGVTELLVILGLVATILILAYNRFHWLYQMEAYARYILTNDKKLMANASVTSTNPISKAINQLILSNSKLEKDKLDLTEQIRKISYVDEVTDLGNQLFFKAEFQVRLHSHEEPESGLLILLSFVEFDHTEELILDDLCLQTIANLLRHFTAEIPNALVARLKGSDFAMLLPNQTRENTDKICKNIIHKLSAGIFEKTGIKEHFVDIGISAYKQGFDYYKVLAEADMALRNSQLQGGNNWFMYGEALDNKKVRGNLKWRSFLQRILDKRKVQLFVQRSHFFNSQKVTHLEVFARIEDGEDILAADTFLPMANQCGLAAEFDRQVVDGVIKHCMYGENKKQNNIYSINLFISSLLDERFVSWLVGRLSSYTSELRHQLTFEIKEAHVNQHLSKLGLVFNQLAELGISWCIERFGSPDEDLTYLDILPITRVKIDRRIVNNIHQSKAQQLLLQTLLINLKSKKIEVFADGVEKEEDANYLITSGVAAAQGFYFGEPKRLGRMGEYLKVV